MLARLEKINEVLSHYLEGVAIVGFLMMMLITCADVLGAKLFLHPVLGSIDIVELSQLVAIAFAAGATLILGRHIQVDFFMVMFPERFQAVVDAIINFFSFALFAVFVWQLIVYGYSLQEGSEVSSTIHLPLQYFAYGFAVASIPLCLISFTEMIKSMVKVVNT
jgi:TRAP-type C4-dicarboxylate transport system permease small subunit